MHFLAFSSSSSHVANALTQPLTFPQNGAIAVVLDKDCNGSIMNPKGKCVCIVNSNGTAKVRKGQ